MGGGSWDASSYAKVTGAKINTGTTFGYDSTMRSRSSSAWTVHPSLDPKSVAGPGSPLAGQTVRESRDNPDNPNTTNIAVFCDSTGSMGNVPRVFQKKMATLFGLLLRKGYCESPSVIIGAYGDAYCDKVPLQISQAEQDNRIDENLDNLFLEGGGGGNDGETMTLALYYLAHHTFLDSQEKRGKKGYAFFVADEKALTITAQQVKDVIGDGEPLGSLKTEDIVAAASEKWDIYILLIDNMSAKIQKSESFYKKLLGEQHVLIVEDPESIAETIALAIGTLEGAIDIDDGVADLRASGASAVAVRSAGNAVSGLRPVGGVLATGNYALANSGSGASRL